MVAHAVLEAMAVWRCEHRPVRGPRAPPRRLDRVVHLALVLTPHHDSDMYSRGRPASAPVYVQRGPPLRSRWAEEDYEYDRPRYAPPPRQGYFYDEEETNISTTVSDAEALKNDGGLTRDDAGWRQHGRSD